MHHMDRIDCAYIPTSKLTETLLFRVKGNALKEIANQVNVLM